MDRIKEAIEQLTYCTHWEDKTAKAIKTALAALKFTQWILYLKPVGDDIDKLKAKFS